MSNENKDSIVNNNDNNKIDDNNKGYGFLSRSWSFMNQVENALASSYNTGFFHGVITGVVATVLAYRSFK
jgi:hypothetical protein